MYYYISINKIKIKNNYNEVRNNVFSKEKNDNTNLSPKTR